MPVLTGTIADVVGSALVAGQVRRAFVRAPAARSSLASGDRLIVPDPVPVDAAGPVSLELEPGPAVLVVDTFAGGPSIYELYVTADMTLLSEAVAESAPAHERSWVESVMVQLRADAVAAAGAAAQSAADADGSAAAAGQSATDAGQSASDAAGSASAAAGSASGAAQSAQDAGAARDAAGGFAADASQSAQDAASSASAAAGSASSAAGSASAAAGSAAAADGHADRAELAADSFGLSATSSTLAPGSPATVTVTGDGPAYSLAFGVPQGDKGDTGTTEWSGITGKPSTFPPATHTHADKADLVGGQVPTSQLPAIALTKPFPVADRAGMLALTAEEGDVAVVTAGADKGTYMLSAGPSTVFSSWVKLTTPDAPVQSVNGQTGTVNLNAANVGARPSSYVPAWSEITSKPATFPPTIGTTASTAKAGNYVPAWSEVTGKPATFPPATHSHTAADTGAVARQGAAQALWIGTTATLPATGTTGVLYVTY